MSEAPESQPPSEPASTPSDAARTENLATTPGPLPGSNDSSDAAAACATTVPEGFLCYKCGYGLMGLPADGDCPECSTPYALSLAFRGKPHPGEAVLVARLFWPFALGVLCLIGLLIFSNTRGPGQSLTGLCSFGLIAAIIINVINLPIVSGSLSAKYVPPHRRRRWSKNMFFLGPWVGTAWVFATIAAVLAVAAPVLAFGACLVMAGGGFR